MFRSLDGHCYYVLIYVDDIVLISDSTVVIQYLITLLHHNFSLKDVGRLNYFLGIEVSYPTTGGLFLSQSKYIIDLLQKTKTLDTNVISTPTMSSSLVSTTMVILLLIHSCIATPQDLSHMLLYLPLKFPFVLIRFTIICIPQPLVISR